MQTMKRMLSLLLSLVMVLSLVPVGALGTGTVVLNVGGTDVSSGGYWTDDGAGGLISGTESNYTVHYEPDSKTLTLRNANIVNAFYREAKHEIDDPYYTAALLGAGIYIDGIEILNLKLEGNNSITAPDLSSADFMAIQLDSSDSRDIISAGIFSGGFYWEYDSCVAAEVIVSGSGTCEVYGGYVDESSAENACSYGISVGKLTINGGTLTCVGSDLNEVSGENVDGKGSGNTETAGVYAPSVMISDGILVGNGGAIDGNGESYGIKMAEINVSGGKLEAYGGPITNATYGGSYGLYNWDYSSTRLWTETPVNPFLLKAVSGETPASGDMVKSFAIYHVMVNTPYLWRDSEDKDFIDSASQVLRYDRYLEVISGETSSDDDEIYVGETNVSSGGFWTSDGVGGLISGTESNYTVRYEPGTNILTLRNAMITKPHVTLSSDTNDHQGGYDRGIHSYGVAAYTDEEEFTLRLEGSSIVSVSNVDLPYYLSSFPQNSDIILSSIGMVFGGNLTVCGDGTCTVTAGNLNENIAGFTVNSLNSSGLYANNLTMNSGTLICNGGSVGDSEYGHNESDGVSVQNLTVNGGTLIGNGGSINGQDGSSYGVKLPQYYNNSLAVNGGVLEGCGGSVENSYSANSYGIYHVTSNGSFSLTGGTIKGIGGDIRASHSGWSSGIVLPRAGTMYGSNGNHRMTAGTLIAVSGSVTGVDLSEQYSSINEPPLFGRIIAPTVHWWRDNPVTAYKKGAATETVYGSDAYEEYDKYVEITSESKEVALGSPVLTGVTNTTTGVKVSWDAVNGAEKYRVFRKTGTGSWTKLTDTVALNYTDKTAASGTTYAYTVRCVSSDGKTYTSAYNTTGKSIKYIAAPVLSKVENVNGGMKLTWGKVSGAAKYRLYRKAGSGSWEKIRTVTETSYTDKTVTSGTKYAYKVRCIASDGTTYSAYGSASKAIRYIAAPKISKVENVNGGVKVTWGRVSGAAKYRLYRKAGSGSWEKIRTVTGTSYTDKTVVSGTKYAYKIRCIASDGTTFSAYSSASKAIKYIATPTISKLEKINSGVRITWDKVKGAERYSVFRKTGNSNWSKLADTTAATYNDRTTVKGKTYSYSVRCISSDGKTYTSGFNTTGRSITR